MREALSPWALHKGVLLARSPHKTLSDSSTWTFQSLDLETFCLTTAGVDRRQAIFPFVRQAIPAQVAGSAWFPGLAHDT